MTKIKVTKESNTGLNQEFYDSTHGKTMTRTEFVKEIEKGKYPGYHVREVDGKKIPASNPDGKTSNNLG